MIYWYTHFIDVETDPVAQELGNLFELQPEEKQMLIKIVCFVLIGRHSYTV